MHTDTHIQSSNQCDTQMYVPSIHPHATMPVAASTPPQHKEVMMQRVLSHAHFLFMGIHRSCNDVYNDNNNNVNPTEFVGMLCLVEIPTINLLECCAFIYLERLIVSDNSISTEKHNIEKKRI